MAKLELERKVGRLLLGRIPSTSLDAQYREALENGAIGGVTIFRENSESLEQLSMLVGEIVESSYHIPIISVDQEGGAVQRLDKAITPLPSPMALAACGDEDLLEKITCLSARQLKMLGVNCLLAPVLDVASNFVNPTVASRAFGSSPDLVGRFGQIVAESIAAEGIVPVGKHFPGHGSATEDSHFSLAINSDPIEMVWKKDLAPFKTALSSLPAVMVGHIWVKEIDEDRLPASLSRRVTHSILRDYLGFDGIVMTDDLIMKGVTGLFGLGEAAVMALEAGNDLLLVCGTIDETMEAHNAILSAVEEGRIPEAQLDQSLARLKRHFSKKPGTCSPSQARKFARLKRLVKEGERLSYSASLRGIAIVRGRIPELAGSNWTILVPDHPRYSFSIHRYLCEAIGLAVDDSTLTVKRYSVQPTFEEACDITEQMRGKNCILLTFRSLYHEDQLRLAQMVADVCLEKLAVSTDSPFDVLAMPDWPNVIATHDPSNQAMRALAQVLVTRTAPGTSPVQPDPIPV